MNSGIGLKIVSRSKMLPVSLVEDFRDFLRITGNEQDSQLNAFLLAATDEVSARADYVIWPTRFEWSRYRFPHDTGSIVLPAYPVRDVVSITFDGDEVDSSMYELRLEERPCRIVRPDGVRWPTDEGILRVEYDAGHADPSTISDSMKQWIKTVAANLYEYRVPTKDAIIEDNRLVASSWNPMV